MFTQFYPIAEIYRDMNGGAPYDYDNNNNVIDISRIRKEISELQEKVNNLIRINNELIEALKDD